MGLEFGSEGRGEDGFMVLGIVDTLPFPFWGCLPWVGRVTEITNLPFSEITMLGIFLITRKKKGLGYFGF